MNSSGYAPRVFSVIRSESRSSSRVTAVEVDVLEDRAEAARRGEDVRLVHRRQADRLGVAAALEVEHAVGAPAVLVVADEARSGSAERVVLPVPERPKKTAASPSRADVDRRVHRQRALVGQEVVHDRERRLLDLAGVLGADDDDLHPLEVDAGSPSRCGCHRSPGSALNDGTSMIVKFGAKPRGPRAAGAGTGCGRRCWPRRSRCRPAASADGRDGRRCRGPGRRSADPRCSAISRARRPVVVLLGDRLVDRPPPDLRPARRLADDELVLRRAPGVLAGANDERAVRRDDPLAVADGVLVQLGGREVAVGRLERRRRGEAGSSPRSPP